MATPRSESDDVAARLAQAADRLKAERVADEIPAVELKGSPESRASSISSGEEALTLLKTLCAELRDADVEVRRARARIAELAAEAAARRAPPEAA